MLPSAVGRSPSWEQDVSVPGAASPAGSPQGGQMGTAGMVGTNLLIHGDMSLQWGCPQFRSQGTKGSLPHRRCSSHRALWTQSPPTTTTVGAGTWHD